jgi:hypothetical protein
VIVIYRVRHLLADVDNVNKFFVNISFDQNYREQDPVSICSPPDASAAPLQPLYAYEVEAMLRKISETAPGSDRTSHGSSNSGLLSLLKSSHISIIVPCAQATCRDIG